MRTRAVYEVELGDEVELFSESETGSLDYEGRLGTEEAAARCAESLGATFPRAELAYPVDDYAPALYLAGGAAAKARVFRRAAPDSPGPEPAIEAFFARYPSLCEALRSGDYGLVATLAQKSRKLAPYSHLVRHIVGGRAALAFALYWLGESDGGKEAALDRLLAGDPSRDSAYDLAFDLARPYIASTNAAEYRRESADLVLAALERGEALVLRVIGTGFRPCAEDLSAFLAALRDEVGQRSILDGADRASLGARIEAYAASVAVSVQPEPYNRHDRNALAVRLRRPERGDLEQAGYLRRDLARFLAPEAANGLQLAASLYRAAQGELSISLRGSRRDSSLPAGAKGI